MGDAERELSFDPRLTHHVYSENAPRDLTGLGGSMYHSDLMSRRWVQQRREAWLDVRRVVRAEEEKKEASPDTDPST